MLQCKFAMKPEHGTIFPSPDILNNLEYGRFVLANLAAKRAKQIKEGAPPLVKVDSNHPLTIALQEIAAGKIRPIIGAAPEQLLGGIDIMEEPRTAELGVLLPALDESEADLLGLSPLGDLVDDEPERELEGSLADLLAADLVETVVPEDPDTLSLADIAEEESAAEDEDGEIHE